MECTPCPASFKAIQPFLKFAQEHDCRDIVVAFWARFYALEEALKLSKKQEDETKLLKSLMDWLENVKKEQCGNEYFTNRVSARAYLESYALKLFIEADKLDRRGVYDKNVVKIFYSSGLLYHIVIHTFVELRDEDIRNQKYAMSRATYINRCVKKGETPVADETPPTGGTDEDGISNISSISVLDAAADGKPGETSTDAEVSSSSADGKKRGIVQKVKESVNESVQKVNKKATKSDESGGTGGTGEENIVKENTDVTAPTEEVPKAIEAPDPPAAAVVVASITDEQKAEAKKHIGDAESALNEYDVNKSVAYLQQALKLLDRKKE